MAPSKKLKTYNRSNVSLVNNSVDAFNVLFAKNMTKRLLTKKKNKLFIKDLPRRNKCESLLGDDSIHISTEDTFDKLLKNPKKKPIENISCDSNAEVGQNNFNSVRITRQSKRLLSSSTSSSSNTIEDIDSIDKTHLLRLQQPSIERIEDSLEIERITKKPSSSLSYITIPKEPNISNETSHLGISATDFMNHLQNVMPHCSTPIAPLKQGKTIKQAVSPLKVNTLLKQTFHEINKWNNEFPLEQKSNVCFSSFLKDISDNTQQSSIFKNITQNSYIQKKNKTPAKRHSYITLRRRKVLKSYKKNDKQSNSFRKNLTVSLESFSNFEFKNLTSKQLTHLKDSINSHLSLVNFKSNKNIDWSNDYCRTTEDTYHGNNEKSISLYRNIHCDDFENFYSSHFNNCMNSKKLSKTISVMENRDTNEEHKMNECKVVITRVNLDDVFKHSQKNEETDKMTSKDNFEHLPIFHSTYNDTFEMFYRTNSSFYNEEQNDTKELPASLNNSFKAQPEEIFETFYRSNLTIPQTEDSCLNNEEKEIPKMKDLIVNLEHLSQNQLFGDNFGKKTITDSENSSPNQEVHKPKIVQDLSKTDVENISNDQECNKESDNTRCESRTKKDLIVNIDEVDAVVGPNDQECSKKYSNTRSESTTIEDLRVSIDEADVEVGPNDKESNKKYDNKRCASRKIEDSKVNIDKADTEVGSNDQYDNTRCESRTMEDLEVNIIDEAEDGPNEQDCNKEYDNKSITPFSGNKKLEGTILDRQLRVDLVRCNYEDLGHDSLLEDAENLRLSMCQKEHFEMFYKDNYEMCNPQFPATKVQENKTDVSSIVLIEDDSNLNESDVIESSVQDILSLEKFSTNKSRENNKSRGISNNCIKNMKYVHVTGDIDQLEQNFNDKQFTHSKTSISNNKKTKLKTANNERSNDHIRKSEDIKQSKKKTKNKSDTYNETNFVSRPMTRSLKTKSKLQDNEIIIMDLSDIRESTKEKNGDTQTNSTIEIIKSNNVNIKENNLNLIEGNPDINISSNFSKGLVPTKDCLNNINAEEINFNLNKANTEFNISVSSSEDQTSLKKDHSLIEVDEISTFKCPKNVFLKPGKSWRRSLSVYKRSSVIVEIPTESFVSNAKKTCPKGKSARQTGQRITNRMSVRFVPIKLHQILQEEECNITELESYAVNTSYVPDQILEASLEDSFRCLSLNPNQRRTSIKSQLSVPVKAREIVLRTCGQTEPIPFSQCFPESVLRNCQKIGEGVYGEVFLFKNPIGGTSVLKIVPVEGNQIVNGEHQKKFEEVLSEIIITIQLSNLRKNKRNGISAFTEVQKIQCVQGRYPEKLLDLWELFDETRGSENDCPDMFGDEQLYIVFQMAYGGKDLESFIFNGAMQAYSMFKQVALALAVAEKELKFEHRDLHWGNVLISTVEANKMTSVKLDNETYDIPTMGIEVAIIDYTLSRIEHDGVVIFNDLGLDPDLFTADGDYQFEIYRLMQQKNENNWRAFEPFSNLLWLDYILEKSLTALRYKNTKTKRHKDYLRKLRNLKEDILSYQSVNDFVVANLLDI